MMLAIEWIDRVKEHNRLTSDAAAAGTLGISRQAVHQMRQEMVSTLKIETAIKVADVLGIPHENVIGDQAAEKAWREIEASRLIDKKTSIKSKTVMMHIMNGRGFVSVPLLAVASALASVAQYILCKIEVEKQITAYG